MISTLANSGHQRLRRDLYIRTSLMAYVWYNNESRGPYTSGASTPNYGTTLIYDTSSQCGKLHYHCCFLSFAKVLFILSFSARGLVLVLGLLIHAAQEQLITYIAYHSTFFWSSSNKNWTPFYLPSSTYHSMAFFPSKIIVLINREV